jgi:hypothetical protein
VGDAELLARVHSAALAPQPLAIQQMAAGELNADTAAAKARDRLAVQTLGGMTLAQQRTDTGFHPQRPLGGRHTGAFGDPVERPTQAPQVAGPGRALRQLGNDKRPCANSPRSNARQAASHAAS